MEVPAKLTGIQGPVEIYLSQVDHIHHWRLTGTMIVLKTGDRIRVLETPEKVHAALTEWMAS